MGVDAAWFNQMLDIHAPLVLGITVYFAQPDALKGSLVKTLREVRPTLFFGVPRVREEVIDSRRYWCFISYGVCSRLVFGCSEEEFLAAEFS